jgi:DNA polymerase
MSPADDLYKELESYLGFLIDHGLDDAYEADPINRTLAENKSTFQRAAASPAQKAVTGVAAVAQASPLRPAALAHLDLSALLSEAKHRALSAKTLDALYTEIEGFSSLPVRHEGGRGLVRGRGSITPELLIIGESPDADEDAAGEAFAGKAGRMMDQALKAAGVLDKTYLSTCSFWRAAGGRPLTAEDISLNAPFLHALIRVLKPKAVLVLGGAAASAVLNVDQPLRTLRGRIVSYTQAEPHIPVAASYPPAFLLRQPQAKAMLWADLLAITAKLQD